MQENDMIEITNLADEELMLSREDNGTDTEFGKILISIIKNPDIPENKNNLFHPEPSKDSRLQMSKLTQEEYYKIRKEWQIRILKSNTTGLCKGLSYNDFIDMIKDLFGTTNPKEIPINKEATHRLVKTANPSVKAFAVTLHESNLKFISCFTKDYSFEYLLRLGNKTIQEYRDSENRAKGLLPEIGTEVSDANNSDNYIQIRKQDIMFDSDGEITPIEEESNNLRTLLHRKLTYYGTALLDHSDVSAKDILSILFDDKPDCGMSTIRCLPDLLGIKREELLRLLILDTHLFGED